MTYTHSDLVARVARWLRNTQRCGVVLTETETFFERPDAIGFTSRTSILVECKTSRSDFLQDHKKVFRRYPDSSVGRLRYYMAPPRLLSISDLPENWGLLEVHPRQVHVARKAMPFKAYSQVHERYLLYVASTHAQSHLSICQRVISAFLVVRDLKSQAKAECPDWCTALDTAEADLEEALDLYRAESVS